MKAKNKNCLTRAYMRARSLLAAPTLYRFENITSNTSRTHKKSTPTYLLKKTLLPLHRDHKITNTTSSQNKSVIYSSFHYSSYRLSILILARLQKHIVHVVSEDVLQEQGLEIQTLYNSICTFPLVLIKRTQQIHSIPSESN